MRPPAPAPSLPRCSVAGISADGTPVEHAVVQPYNVSDNRPDRPEGDVPWDGLLLTGQRSGPQSLPVVANLLGMMRASAAGLLGVPVPPPLQPLAATAAASAAAGSSAADADAASASASSPAAPEAADESAAAAAAPAGGRRGSSRAAAAAASAKLAAAAAPSPSRAASSAASEEEGGGGSSSSSSSAAAAAASEGDDADFAARRARYPGCGLASPALLAARPTAGFWGASVAGGASSSSSSSAGGRDAKKLTALSVRSPRHVMKVAPERIFSVAWHPGAQKLVALAGDKWGRLGVWAPHAERPGSSGSGSGGSSSAAAAGTASPARKRARGAGGASSAAADDEEEADANAGADNDDNEDDGLHTVAVFRPHNSPVSYVVVPPGAPHLVLTASYDGSARALDLNRGVSWLLTTVGDDASKGLSALEVDALAPAGGDDTAALLWVGGYEGDVWHVDTRLPPGAKAAGWAAHDKKVTALSAQRGGHTLLSSSSDATVKLWDVRKLPRQQQLGAGGKSSSSKAAAPSPLGLLAHGAAVSSAFFSPDGGRVVSTSSDNKLRVWSAAAAAAASGAPVRDPPSTSIYHDNHTGRWLSQFRTVWDPAGGGRTFVVGAMNRCLEVYDAGSGSRLAALSSELLTAVPTLNAVHPCPAVNAVVSGTASGRMYLWT
jgi:hypothetical protein